MKKILTLLMLTAASFIATAKEFSTPEEAAKATAQAIIDNNISTIKDLFTDELQTKITNDGNFNFASKLVENHKRVSQLIEENGGINKITTEPNPYKTDQKIKVKIKVILHFNNGKIDEGEMNLTKTEKGWKIYK